MANLAVSFVALVLLQAASSLRAASVSPNPALTIVVTDAISDVIRLYNNNNRPNLPVALKDVRVQANYAPNVFVNLTMTEGSMSSKKIQFWRNEAQISFNGSQKGEEDRITAIIPISLKGLEIVYKKLAVQLDDDIGLPRQVKSARRTVVKPSVPAVQALVEPNKFLVRLQVVHILGKDGHYQCTATIDNIAVPEFEVKHFEVTAPPEAKKIAEDVINAIKAKIIHDSYAPTIIEDLIREKSSNFFPYCQYLTPKLFEAYMKKQ